MSSIFHVTSTAEADSVISTCGMCRCERRARAKQQPVLRNGSAVALFRWGFLFDRAPESDDTAVSGAHRYGDRAGGVLRQVVVFSQP